MQNIITNSTTGLSKNSKAIQLFCNNKKPIEVALELNMHANDVNKAYLDFMRLSGLDRFTDLIMDENKQKLILMLKVIDTFNKNGIKNIDSINNVLIEIKYYENIKQEINCFSKVLDDVKFQIITGQNEINEKNKIIKKKRDWVNFKDYPKTFMIWKHLNIYKIKLLLILKRNFRKRTK